MAKSRFGAPRMLPDWPNEPQGSAPTLSGNIILTTGGSGTPNTGNRLFVYGDLIWADGGTHDIRSVKWRHGVNCNNSAFGISLRDVDLANGPVARDDGTADHYVRLPSSGNQNITLGNYTSTFPTDKTNVATGTSIGLVFDMETLGSGSFRLRNWGTNTTRSARPQVTTFISSAWSVVSSIPMITFVAADGTLGYFSNGLPYSNAEMTTTTVNTGSTPDEVALAYTCVQKEWLGHAEVFVNPAAGAAFDVILYQGTTALVTRSIDPDTFVASAQPQRVAIAFPDIELTAGTTYYLAVKPTTATNVTYYYAEFETNDLAMFAGGCGYGSRTDAGSWTTLTTRIPLGWSLGFVAADDGASAGKVKRHPGMSGGMRG